MSQREPPALATWLLRFLPSQEINEGLSGDLLEAFRAGRSARWYWFQVTAAIAIATCRTVSRHRGALFFAAAWSVLSPGWALAAARFDSSNLIGYTSVLPWPWSFDCDLLFFASATMLFIWLGVAVYLMLHCIAIGKPSGASMLSGFIWGAVAFSLASACSIAISFRYPPLPGPVEHLASLTVLGVIKNSGKWSDLLRLPYLSGALATLWFLKPTNTVNGQEPF